MAQPFHRNTACESNESNETIHRYVKTFISRDMVHKKAQVFIISLNVNAVNVVKICTGI
jgi:hypothetical protein